MSRSVMKENFHYDGRPWEQREFFPQVAFDIWDVHENGYWATLSIWVGDDWQGDYSHHTGRANLLCREDASYFDKNVTEYINLPLVQVDPNTREVSDESLYELLQAADVLFSQYLAEKR